MKHLSHILLTLFVALVSLTAVAADNAVPAISLETKKHDFGIIDESKGLARCTFRFTNTGSAPLVIISADASCGCTRPTYPKEPVKPGKSGEIKVSYNPSGRPGEFNKTIKVRTNDPHAKKITLKISGTVNPAE